MNLDPHRLSTVANALTFILAGNAYFTLRSKKTNDRFTFRVRKPDKDKPHFVSVLTGSNNETDYTFFGTIFPDGHSTHSPRSAVTTEATSAKAFWWFWSALKNNVLPETVEVWHEGRCGRCGRALTVPESIERGLGPECATKYTIQKVA